MQMQDSGYSRPGWAATLSDQLLESFRVQKRPLSILNQIISLTVDTKFRLQCPRARTLIWPIWLLVLPKVSVVSLVVMQSEVQDPCQPGGDILLGQDMLNLHTERVNKQIFMKFLTISSLIILSYFILLVNMSKLDIAGFTSTRKVKI